ncbi:MAG: PQQ-binding-like beta-propeller repeat protein [bacterium]|nr:PQQ-binding-like beta-propeller repeat protein [bacterium]
MTERTKSPAIVLFLATLSVGIVAADSTEGSAGAAALDWPQWRGPKRDAVSLQTGLLQRWPEGGPEVLWRTPVGAGYSGVSVSQGKLYTLWDEKGKQFLFGLDASTGKELWRQQLGAAFNNHYGNGPRSTPLVDGDVVFAIGTQGLLLAANRHTGARLWQHDMVQDYAADLPSYGYSSSPLVAGDKLVVEVGGKDAAFMAFDKKTGETVWAVANDRPAYSSPIDVTIAGVDQVVFWSAHGLHSVSSDGGSVLWTYSWETFCPVSGDPLNTGTPLFLPPDRIYISSGSGAAAIRVARGAGAFTVETVWKSDLMRSDVNTALLLDGHIYGFDRGTLKSLDASTGEINWKARGFQRGSLIAADGRLIVLGEAGNLALVKADPSEFVQTSSVEILEGKNWTAPALAGGKLYLRNHEELVCLEMTGS